MPIKRIKTDGRGSAVDNPVIKSTAKPKPYKEPDKIRAYRLERERYFWVKFPEQRAEIEEFVKEMKHNWNIQDKRK